MSVNFHPAQEKIAMDTHRFRVVNCGRRFGKTFLSVYEMLSVAYAKECTVCYIAPTFQQARDIAWAQLKKVCKPVTKSTNEQRLEIVVQNSKGTKSQILLRGWESVETLRGQKFAFIVIDEVASMRDFNVSWSEVLRPTITDTQGSVLFISTPKGFNHFYDLYNMELKHEDWKSFHFTTYDNPTIPEGVGPKGRLKALEKELAIARSEIGETRFAQEYLAEFAKVEGLVYQEFDRKVHVVDKEPESVIETLLGVDFGFTNPCAVITVKRDYDNNFWITNEWYKRGKTEREIAEQIKGTEHNAVYADPENPSAIKVLTDDGINVMEVIKGRGSVLSGIDKVRSLLLQKKLFIHKSCANVISEFESYAYPDKKNNSNFNRNEKENPIKENDHSMDAIRYVISMNVMSNPVKEDNWDLYAVDYD